MDSKSGKSWLFGLIRMACADDKVFAVGANAKKVANRARGDIFSDDWTRNM
jgi:hypothetical protein